MRVFLAGALAGLLAIGCAQARPVPIASDGIWTAFGDVVSATKVCGVQARVGDGIVALFGREDTPTTLRLTLKKPDWRLPTPAPIVITFVGSPDAVSTVGAPDGEFLRASVPTDQVRMLIHHFTADKQAIVTFPATSEPLWLLDLTGTTPTVEAMAECLAIAHIWLPPPFRQVSSDGGTPAASFVEAPIAAPPSIATAAVGNAAPPPAPQPSIPNESSKAATLLLGLARADYRPWFMSSGGTCQSTEIDSYMRGLGPKRVQWIEMGVWSKGLVFGDRPGVPVAVLAVGLDNCEDLRGAAFGAPHP